MTRSPKEAARDYSCQTGPHLEANSSPDAVKLTQLRHCEGAGLVCQRKHIPTWQGLHEHRALSTAGPQNPWIKAAQQCSCMHCKRQHLGLGWEPGKEMPSARGDTSMHFFLKTAYSSTLRFVGAKFTNAMLWQFQHQYAPSHHQVIRLGHSRNNTQVSGSIDLKRGKEPVIF